MPTLPAFFSLLIHQDWLISAPDSMAFECPDRADWNWNVSYQWTLSRHNCVEVDSDAVGIGVTTAFVLSAFVLLTAIAIGYTTSSTPEDLIGGFDRMFIEHVQCLSGRHPSARLEKSRTDAMAHFLLALGDQQMVTALALLIAGYAHWYDITIYAMNVTGALTLLSSTVYLSVLPIVTARDRAIRDTSTVNGADRQRFSRLSGLAKHFRFTSVVFIFLGMAFLFVLSEGSYWWPGEDVSNLYFLCGLRNFSITQEDLFTAIINFFILLGFASGYVDAFVCLYTDEISLIEWIVRRLELRWGIQKPSMPEDYIAFRSARIETGRWNWWQASLLDESFAFYSFYSFDQSFASWQLIDLVFAFTYGTINIFVSRNLREGLTGDANSWGFGQIVPMILLALPLLAAFEARADYKMFQDDQCLFPEEEDNQSLKPRPSSDEAPALVLDDSLTHTKPGQEDSDSIATDFVSSSDVDAINLSAYPPQPAAPIPMLNPSPVPSTKIFEVSVQGTLNATATTHPSPSASPATLTATAAPKLSYTTRSEADSDDIPSPSTRQDIESSRTDPWSPHRLSRHPRLARWDQTPPNPLQWPDIRLRMYLHALLFVIVSLSLAISTSLWSLGSPALTIVSRLCFGYLLADGLRSLHSYFVIALCLKQPERGGLQIHHVAWLRRASKILVVVAFLALLYRKYVFDWIVAIQDVFYIVFGAFLALVLWGLIAVVPG